jgi:hypothetical protein
MRGQDFLFLIFVLILAYLLLAHGKEANALLGSVTSGSVNMVKALQGRS